MANETDYAAFGNTFGQSNHGSKIEYTDYVRMKEEFYEKIKEYFSANREEVEITKQEIINIISEIKTLKQDNAASTVSLINRTSKYEVVKDSKENNMLIFKRAGLCDRLARRVPASEDIFDILLKAHIVSGHGSKKDMFNNLTIYGIPNVYFDTFIPLCKVCKGITPQRIAMQFGDSVEIKFIDMKILDNGFRFVMVYVDRATNYTLLRPLSSLNEPEAAMELTKLFTDFGPPKKIETTCRYFVEGAVNLVVKCYFDFKPIPVIEVKVTEEEKILTIKIDKWLNEAKCNGWSFALYMIQWEINNTLADGNVMTPYDKVYRDKQPNNLDVTTSTVEKDIIQFQEPAEIVDILDVEILDDNENNNKKIEPELEQNSTQACSEEIAMEIGKAQEQQSLHTEEDLGFEVKYEQDIDVSDAEDNETERHSVSDIETIDISADAENDEKPKDTICPECKCLVKNSCGSLCYRCMKEVHKYCSTRQVLLNNDSKPILTTICISCNIIETRLKELKKKYTELNKLLSDTGTNLEEHV